MFKQLGIKAVYRSDSCNILEDFYLPTLAHSISYDRAVGFFSAASLFSAAQGISALLENGGRMRLVVGGELSLEDMEAIETGYNVKNLGDAFGEMIVKEIDSIVDNLFKKRLEALSLLVASDRLDVKIAYKPIGMYHEKIGILTDREDNKLIFQGSANETRFALLPEYNFESINVFSSWRPELEDHFKPYLDGFERLWEGKTKNVYVAPFPDALRDNLIKISKHARPFFVNEEVELASLPPSIEEDISPKFNTEPVIPKFFKGNPFDLYKHQREALYAWKGNDFRGILELATGAGKTVTAITGAVRTYQATHRLFCIIAVPYQNLADQWIQDLKQFNIHAHKCYGGRSQWHQRFSELVTLFNTGSVSFLCAVVVNRTLSTEVFQRLINDVPGDSMLFIGDECHHHSSSSTFGSLPKHARLRLGLSATPWHHMNLDANTRLTEYYSDSVYQYTLEQALSDKVLTPYKYHVIPVEFTEVETEKYLDVSVQIAQLFSQKNKKDKEEKRLQSLLLQRARIIGSAKNKFVELEQLIQGQGSAAPFSLFYCGDGTVEDEVTGEENRQIEQLSELLYKNGWRTSRFTSYEPNWTRSQLLNHFRIGVIDSLVAIRCLDEGIDVPACRTAYILASSTNPRQQVQRRGRILRKAHGKNFAEIYDFIVKLPNPSEETNKYERSLLKKELTRVAEFASLAINSGEVIDSLMPILEEYDLSYLLA
ncbi:DEAD/DEAH box helicase family protein [Desulfovibrio sp. Fe33]|uniref:DEAD/DEAH box helicase family protein n=1 Tax=Desulfovibrio sp. Fe33 TaxID=3020842 RepID=UPI00234E2B3A|nr:DEAD/DEAH box helicase family protein [Desulfovibrio sp. Fe33]